MKELSNNTSLTDEIADVVRERILKGEYQIGEKLRESLISEELKVSRTPIRDAFKILENEGLIDYVPNRGCFAKGFTKQDVEDIYTVRIALERIAVRWAVSRITEEELVNLEEQCELMEFYARKQDTKKVLELNSSFHDIIYNSTRSRFLAQVLRSYKEYLDKGRKTVLYNPEYLNNIQKEHLEVFNAIKSRDVEAAEATIVKHLEKSRERTEKMWNLR